jgi:hypothetical protein
VSREEIPKILSRAWASGIDTLDTAMEYGESEERLGEAGVQQWKIISKLPEIPEHCSNVASWLEESLIRSLDRLKVPNIYGLLLHRPQQLLGPQGKVLYRALVDAREQGKVEKIGISVYSPDELDALWPYYKFDLIQAPYNILDRRLVSSGWLARLNQFGSEVHVRSVFLQGLLLMETGKRHDKFNRWQSLWDDWHRWLVEHKSTALQTCLGFALSESEITRVVVGVDSLQQLEKIIATDNLSLSAFPESIECADVDLIDPTEWAKL